MKKNAFKNKISAIKKLAKNKGLYFILALCLVGAGIASVVSYNKSLQSVDNNNDKIIEQKKTENTGENSHPEQVGKGVSDISLPQTSLPEYSNSSSSSQQSNAQQTNINASQESIQSQNQLYILPVAGEVSAKFSKDILVKNPTLNVWRTHNGVDINAPVDTPVKACNDGIVTKVFEDVVWGVGVEITHSDGAISTCFGLAKDVTVKEKDDVKLGDIIGKVLEIPGEKGEAHVHFEIVKEDEFIDPLSLLKKI